MAQFGVSRPTLREAFRILEAEDLISVKRGSRGGARVTQPSLSVAARYVGLLLQVQGTTIADVYEARMVLEPACARLLARRRTKQDLADLSACIEELAPEPALWSSRAARFHELIMQRSGSKTLAVQGGVLQDIVATHLAMALSRDRAGDDELANFRRNVRSYEKLVELVDKRDAPGAERQPGPRTEFILRDEHRPSVGVDLGRYLRGRALEPSDGVAACYRSGDPGHDAEMALPEPVAQDGLGGIHVHGLVPQQRPDARCPGHALVPEPVLLLGFVGGYELF